MKTTEFLKGYLCAIQYIAINHDLPTIAEEIIREGGYSKQDYTAAQYESGFYDKKMIVIISNAFKK